MIHSNSAHPEKTKIQNLRNMIRTAEEVSSAPFKNLARQRAVEIALCNGYREEALNSRYRSPFYFPQAPCLRLPFITERFSVKLQRIFLKYDLTVNIVCQAPQTLRQLLVRSRLYDRRCRSRFCPDCVHRNGICKIKGVIYQIECSLCGQIYIGETGRPLADRIKEHLADIRYCQNRSGPWASHTMEVHGGNNVDVSVSILATETRLQERMIKEALFIKAKNPEINGRAEMGDTMKFICDL